MAARRQPRAQPPIWPPLRPYQIEVARAIVAAVRARDGRTISVQIARQGGKNELAARVEAGLLLMPGSGDMIKVAPSLRPQGHISLNRLWSRLVEARLAPPALRDRNSIAFGGNRLLLLSAAPGASVVGHTAGALMEVDEAQDVDSERFSRDFRPMGASRATATAFYGTPWTETSLLEEMKQRHIELERRDGIRRHFAFDWQVVAAANPAYGHFALQERDRLGEQHPAWRTQYCLETVPGAGRLFSPQQRALLHGLHPRIRSRSREFEGAVLVAGLDVAGEAFVPGRDQDETVFTLLRVEYGVETESGEFAAPALEILDHLVWRGASHDLILSELSQLLARTWRPAALAIDVTGIGEGLAAGLQGRSLAGAHRTRILRYRLSEQTKSRLGFGLLAAAGGRLRCYASDGSREYRDFWRQVERARAVYKPNHLMGFSVDPADGHDDYLTSLALAVEAVEGAQPRIARGRRPNAAEDPA
jgi:hypothetical protein